MIKIVVNFKSSVRIEPSQFKAFLDKHNLKCRMDIGANIKLIDIDTGMYFGEVEQ